MFSQNYKIIKLSIQSEQKFTSVKKHLSPKTLIGPGKLRRLSRNGSLNRYCNALTTIVMQSSASNNGLLIKDAPYLNAFSTQNFKSQMDSPYFNPF